ncbi:MAG: hypothetical protein P8M78_09365 [Myxococcota bacterium]|nr:hypothetical protein [Myxococcota bacterium]
MKRFSRRRRGGASRNNGPSPLDASLWLGRLTESEALGEVRFEPLEHEDVPASLAVVGRSASAEGDPNADPIIAVVSPKSAGDALLAALATGARLAEEESFTGRVAVVAPEWSVAARRRLALIRAELPYSLRPVEVASLSERPSGVEPEVPLEAAVVPLQQVIDQGVSSADRNLFRRSVTALSGLAVKHGGAVRGTPQSVELVVMARRTAEIRFDRGVLTLITYQPQRNVVPIEVETLAASLDALEGQIRRRVNDRKVRDGEDGLRTRLLVVLENACGLRDTVVWPVGGSDHDPVDLVGVDEQGRPVVAAARKKLGLREVGAFLDSLQTLKPSLPTILEHALAPVRFDALRVVLAADQFAAGALRALSGLALAHDLFTVDTEGSRGVTVTAVAAEEAMQSIPDRANRRGRGRGRSRKASEAVEPREGADPVEEAGESNRSAEAGVESAEGPSRNRSRRRRRGGRHRTDQKDSGSTPPVEDDAAKPEGASEGFEELSLFDLDEGQEESGRSSEGSEGRRHRGRNRRRGRKPNSEDASPPAQASASDASTGGDEADEDLHDEDIEDTLSDLPDELESAALPERRRGADSGEAEDEDEEEETLSAALSMGSPVASPESSTESSRPRRRAVIVACADRDSLLAAVLLARDIRLLEGLWVYPQDELMSFFRETATDLGGDVPIHVVGFAPSPAIDVLQAASLYRDRISWYDHHDWAPEDAFALKQTLGEAAVHHTPGAGTCLPAVLRTCTRRSRFSDKLVDLATARFSQHDYERWGRLWWWRLGEAAGKRGDVRSEVAAILTGRPSELTREAADIQAPSVPEEVAFVNAQDFRIVHFVGFGMAVMTAPAHLDPYLVGRITRERLETQLSLVRLEGTGRFILAGEEPANKRMLDVCALIEHLGNKLAWVTDLPNEDHVARFNVADLEAHPARLDEVIGEIAMGRSILER